MNFNLCETDFSLKNNEELKEINSNFSEYLNSIFSKGILIDPKEKEKIMNFQKKLNEECTKRNLI